MILEEIKAFLLEKEEKERLSQKVPKKKKAAPKPKPRAAVRASKYSKKPE